MLLGHDHMIFIQLFMLLPPPLATITSTLSLQPRAMLHCCFFYGHRALLLLCSTSLFILRSCQPAILSSHKNGYTLLPCHCTHCCCLVKSLTGNFFFPPIFHTFGEIRGVKLQQTIRSSICIIIHF